MKRVYQTKLGASGASPEERGNCVQAAVASLLGFDLEDVPDFGSEGEGWWGALREWGLGCGLAFVAVSDRLPVGRAIAVVDSAVLEGEKHVIVVDEAAVKLHDPNPNVPEEHNYGNAHYWIEVYPSEIGTRPWDHLSDLREGAA